MGLLGCDTDACDGRGALTGRCARAVFLVLIFLLLLSFAFRSVFWEALLVGGSLDPPGLGSVLALGAVVDSRARGALAGRLFVPAHGAAFLPTRIRVREQLRVEG